MSIEGKRRVEFVVDYKHGGEQFHGPQADGDIGDTVWLEKSVADTLVDAGVCRDPLTGEQNELKPGQHKIQPDSVKQKATRTESHVTPKA